MVQATPNQSHHFRSNTITFSVTNHMSQCCLNVCTWIKAGSTNRSKQVAWDDVTNHFLFHTAAILSTYSTHLQALEC